MAIDKVSFGFSVLDKEVGELTSKPEDGCYIYGLFLEGAGWDARGNCLCESRPKELYVVFPPMWLEPKVDRPLTRAGTLSTTGHSTNFVLMVELPSEEPCSGNFERYSTSFSTHWIKRAVALFCALNY